MTSFRRYTKNQKLLMLILLTIFSVTTINLYSYNVKATGGAVIGGDDNMGGGGSGGPSGSGCPSDKIGKDGGVDCMGVSWIYYEATGNAGDSGTNVWFSPRIHEVDNPIPADCSVAGRGVWVYGVGGYGQWQEKYTGSGQYVFRPNVSGSSHYVLNGEGVDAENVYSTSNGGRGLQGVYPWGYQGDGSAAWSHRVYRTFSGLSHSVYKKLNGTYTEIYRAKKYGVIGDSNNNWINARSMNLNETNPEVWKNFKTAWQYANSGEDYPGTNFPDSLAYFCYWDGMETHTLYAYAISSVNGASLGQAGAVEAKNGGKLSFNKWDIEGYKFRYWTNEDLTRVTATCPRDNKKYFCVENSGNTIAVEEPSKDRTAYAVYTPYETLSATSASDTGIALAWSNSDTVLYNDNAHVTAPNTTTDANGNSYIFIKWVNSSGTHVTATCPRDSTQYACIDPSNERKLRVDTLRENKSYTAIYARRVLTGQSIDESGNALTWANSDGVYYNYAAHVTAPATTTDASGNTYKFLRWINSSGTQVTTTCPRSDTQYACLDPNNSRKLRVDTLRNDRTYYAVYARRTLTGQSVNENGTVALTWSNSKTVPYGDPVTLDAAPEKTTDSSGNEYGFIGWGGVGNCPPSDSSVGCLSTNNKRLLGVPSLTVDRTYYAYYGRRSLTGVAVEYGTGYAATGIDNASTTIAYGFSATITRTTPTYNWVFQGWATSPTATTFISTDTSYTVNPLTSDTTIYMVYRRIYHVSMILKDVGTRDNFNNLQVNVDNVNKYGNLDYTGGPYGNANYSHGVWEINLWRGQSFSGILPGEVTINGTSYRRVGWYSVANDENVEYSQYCSSTTINQKWDANPTGTDYTFGTNSAAGCYAIWGAYVAVRHLTALAYDTSNYYIGDNQYTTATSKWPVSQSYKRIADQRVTVFNGETASLTRNTNIGYEFKGWKEFCPWTTCGYFTNTDSNQASYLSNGGVTYTVKSLTANGIVYPIYEIRRKTLTGISVDEWGNSLAGISGLGNKTDTVDYWEPAQITRGMAEGFTYYGWSESLNGAKTGSYVTATSGATYISAASDSTIANIDNTYSPRGVYHVSSMTDSSITPVYARYDRNEFQGRVRASSGNSVNESSNTSTGWVESDTSQSLTIECPNTGCNATFDLHLKTIKGLGKTNYVVSRNKNGGSYSQLVTTPTSPFKPSTSGSAISRVGANYTETLYPGESVCYRISFKPYGGTYPNYRANSTFANATACVSARVSGFEGKSSVTGATTGTTDWRKTNRTDTVFIQNCSPTSGCNVSFNHRLRREANTGTQGWTDYTIARTSNLTDTTRGIANNTNVKSGTFNPSSPTTEQEVSSTGPFTLYPGMVVCETLTFKPHNSVVSAASTVTTKICASALGSAQPDDPTPSTCNEATDPSCSSDPDGDTGSNALVDIEVKNTSVAKYNSYRRVVYGKPNDVLNYRATYNPNLQYTYYLKPEQMRIDSGTIYPSSTGTNTSKSLATMFNEHKTPGWNNDIIVYSTNFTTDSYSQTHSYTNGEFSKRTETNDHSVAKLEVGRSLNENAEINYPSNDSIKTTPVQVSFSANNTRNLANVSTSRKYRIAYARIPYNYTTTISVPTPDPVTPTPVTPDPGDPGSPTPATPGTKVPAPEIVYAGEDKQINVKVDINPKSNSVTNNPGDPDYATKTGLSTVKIIVYLADNPKTGTDNYSASRTSDLCSYFGSSHSEVSESWTCSNYVAKEESFNSAGNLDGETTTFPSTFNIPDLDAGKKICTAAAIYPSYSGLDTNWNSTDGSSTWRISNSRCFIVAKRPNLQVLGGSMYSAGNLATSVAAKRNVFGIYPVKISGSYKNNTTIFGSWVEHQIVSVGNTAGIASGAATGYFGRTSSSVPTSGRTPKANLGGSWEGTSVDYCIRIPLTIANTTSAIPCKNSSIAGGYTSIANATSPTDKEKLIARFTQETDNSGIDYIKTNGDYTLNESTIPKGITRVIHATGNITINGNQTYEDDYTNLNQIPKLIIYAEKNIYINCYVTRIDAVLIAGKTNSSYGVVNTCPTNFTAYTGDISSEINWKQNGITLINSRANSHQLKITGTVIANKLIANRTYGAAKGINSVVPAEVIDYDATLYGWGMKESESSASGRLQTVYLHEVAPRY